MDFEKERAAKHQCDQDNCEARLSYQYKDGRFLCRTHLVEIMDIDHWIDDWITKYHNKNKVS